MPILSISTQPGANTLQAAYRPVVFKVNANAASVTSFPVQMEFVAGNTIKLFAPSQTIIDFLAVGNKIVITGSVSNSATFTITAVGLSVATTTGVTIYTLTVTETVVNEAIKFVYVKNFNNLVASPAIVFCDIYFGGVYYKSISKTLYESIYPNGTANQLNTTFVVTNNGDGSQTVVFTFDPIPGSPISLNIISTPLAGGIPTGNAGAPTSTRTITQPVGSYIYTFQAYFGSGIPPISFTTTAVEPYTTWSFDIQDAMQEVLAKAIGVNGGLTMFTAAGVTALTYCKFRVCGYDANGFIVSEVSQPVQASGKIPAISGGGTQSNSFYSVNAALQHLNNQDLASHLASFLANTRGAATWSNAYPMTHRPAKYPLSLYDNDYYPFIYVGGSLDTSILRIKYKIKGLNVYKEAEIAFVYALAIGNIYNVPSGPKNLKPLFPTVEWLQVDEYFLELWTATPSPTQILSTCAFKVAGYTDKSIRVHFLNYVGTYDGVTFNRANIQHEDTSTDYQKSLPYPLKKIDGSHGRMNIKSNDTYEVGTIDYLEEDQIWLQELKDSPTAFIEWTGAEGQPDDYMPVTVEPGKVVLLKNTTNDFQYEFRIRFKLSNDFQIIRS